MGRLETLRVVDPVLTELARGYSNANFILEALFPTALIGKEAGIIPIFPKEAFKLINTKRAIRAKSNRISPEGRSSTDVVLEEHDAEYPVDYREAAEDVFPLESYATDVATSMVALEAEKDGADLASDPDTYPTGSKVTLTGNDQWSSSDTSNPISDVREGMEAVRSKIGRYPNTMVLGASCFKTLQDHPKILARIQYAMKGIVTPELLKEIFDIQNLVIGKAVWAADDDTMSDVWGDVCILAWVPPASASGRSYYDPSFGYRLRKRGQPVVDKYEENGGKLTIVRSTDIYKVKVVGSDAGYLINDVNAPAA